MANCMWITTMYVYNGVPEEPAAILIYSYISKWLPNEGVHVKNDHLKKKSDYKNIISKHYLIHFHIKYSMTSSTTAL